MPPSTETLSALSTKAHSRKICTFARAANKLLEVDGLNHCATVLDIVETLILPEVARFGKVKGNETMRLVVLLVMEVLCLEAGESRLTRSAHLLTQWIRNPSPWKFELEGALSYLVGDVVDIHNYFLTPLQIENDELSKIGRVFSSLGRLPGDVQKSITAACFPGLCDVRVLRSTYALGSVIQRFHRGLLRRQRQHQTHLSRSCCSRPPNDIPIFFSSPCSRALHQTRSL